MGLTNEHVGPKILAKIKIYALTRAELLFNLCYEIPCISVHSEPTRIGHMLRKEHVPILRIKDSKKFH